MVHSLRWIETSTVQRSACGRETMRAPLAQVMGLHFPMSFSHS